MTASVAASGYIEAVPDIVSRRQVTLVEWFSFEVCKGLDAVSAEVRENVGDGRQAQFRPGWKVSLLLGFVGPVTAHRSDHPLRAGKITKNLFLISVLPGRIGGHFGDCIGQHRQNLTFPDAGN